MNDLSPLSLLPNVESLQDIESAHILRVLDRYQGHMTRTAAALGICRTTLWQKLRGMGLSAKDCRQRYTPKEDSV